MGPFPLWLRLYTRAPTLGRLAEQGLRSVVRRIPEMKKRPGVAPHPPGFGHSPHLAPLGARPHPIPCKPCACSHASQRPRAAPVTCPGRLAWVRARGGGPAGRAAARAAAPSCAGGLGAAAPEPARVVGSRAPGGGIILFKLCIPMVCEWGLPMNGRKCILPPPGSL